MCSNINNKSEEERKNLLLRCAQISLNSKLFEIIKNFYQNFIVNDKDKLEELKDKDLIGIKHITGGSTTDSFLFDGVVFKKISHMSFLNNNQKIWKYKNYNFKCLIGIKIRERKFWIENKHPEDFRLFVDADWKIIHGGLENIVNSKEMLF